MTGQCMIHGAGLRQRKLVHRDRVLVDDLNDWDPPERLEQA